MPTLNITGKTDLYGIIAHPTDHVRAPMVFNSAYERLGIDAVMLPLNVAPETLAMAVAGLRAVINLKGAAVTVPHKVEIAKLCDRLGDNGRRVGAVNAVRFDRDGCMYGDNFDGQGYISGMKAAGFDFADKSIFQVGAGGAGRAIAFAVAQAGATSLTISNRTATKAEALAARVRKEFPDCVVTGTGGEAVGKGVDIVINTTLLGLHEGDQLPIDLGRLDPGTAVSEIIMVPEQTALLKQAKAKGHPIYFGRPMLDEQVRLIAEFMGCPLTG